jgi:hypothetical protein
MTKLIPFNTSDKIYDHLLSYDKERIIIGITKFLNEEQRKDLLDSLDREIF